MSTSVVAAYDHWEGIRTRSSWTGIAMMPTAGPPAQPSVPVALCGGVEYDVVEFTAARWGAPPIIPSPSLATDQNRVFLGGAQSAIFSIPVFADTKLFYISGYYIWGILNPEGLKSRMLTGSPPLYPDGSDQALNFGEYLDMANIQKIDLITQGPAFQLPTGDGSAPEPLPPMEGRINTTW